MQIDLWEVLFRFWKKSARVESGKVRRLDVAAVVPVEKVDAVDVLVLDDEVGEFLAVRLAHVHAEVGALGVVGGAERARVRPLAGVLALVLDQRLRVQEGAAAQPARDEVARAPAPVNVNVIN